MTVCSKCGHGNDAGKDFCAECGEFLGWGDDPPPPVKRPATVAAIGPTRVAAAAAADDPAVRQAEEDARIAEEEALRVRAEAERRASEATERAKRLATEEARGARKAAYSRAEQVVEMASMTAGGSQAEVAALVAQVRREAESKAQIEVGDAELRAARKARRAREEAHARARAESAEAEQKAKEASERAVALIARAPSRAELATQPTPKVTEPVAVSPSSAVQTTAKAAGGANAVAPVKPVPPSAPHWQPPAATPEEVQVVNPGDVVCRTCSTANDPSRRFCRKCAGSLVFVPPPPSLSWSQRMRTWLQRLLGRIRRRPGDPAPEAPAPGSSGPGMSMAGLTRGALALVAVAGVFLAIGPYRQEVTSDITGVRKRIVPKPSYIDGEVASAAPNATVIKTLTDKTLDPAPFTSSAVVGSNLPGPDTPPAFSVALGKDGDLTKPVNVFKVGIVGDTLGEKPPKHPSVHHLYIVAYGRDGQQKKAKSLTLHDDPSFQSFLFAVNHVSRVDFFVLDTYASADRQGPYTIDQVEFFALT